MCDSSPISSYTHDSVLSADGTIWRSAFPSPSSWSKFVASPWATHCLGKRTFDSKTEYKEHVLAAAARDRRRTLAHTVDLHIVRRLRLGELTWAGQEDAASLSDKRQRRPDVVQWSGEDEEGRQLTFKRCMPTELLASPSAKPEISHRDYPHPSTQAGMLFVSSLLRRKGDPDISSLNSDVFGPARPVLGTIVDFPNSLAVLRPRMYCNLESTSPTPLSRPSQWGAQHRIPHSEHVNSHIDDMSTRHQGSLETSAVVFEHSTLCDDKAQPVVLSMPLYSDFTKMFSCSGFIKEYEMQYGDDQIEYSRADSDTLLEIPAKSKADIAVGRSMLPTASELLVSWRAQILAATTPAFVATVPSSVQDTSMSVTNIMQVDSAPTQRSSYIVFPSQNDADGDDEYAASQSMEEMIFQRPSFHQRFDIINNNLEYADDDGVSPSFEPEEVVYMTRYFQSMSMNIHLKDLNGPPATTRGPNHCPSPSRSTINLAIFEPSLLLPPSVRQVSPIKQHGTQLIANKQEAFTSISAFLPSPSAFVDEDVEMADNFYPRALAKGKYRAIESPDIPMANDMDSLVPCSGVFEETRPGASKPVLAHELQSQAAFPQTVQQERPWLPLNMRPTSLFIPPPLEVLPPVEDSSARPPTPPLPPWSPIDPIEEVSLRPPTPLPPPWSPIPEGYGPGESATAG